MAKPANTFDTREAWDRAAWKGLDPLFDELKEIMPVIEHPEKVRIGTGYLRGGKQAAVERPSKTDPVTGKTIPGKKASLPVDVWPARHSADGTDEVFIQPDIDNPLERLGLLVYARLRLSLPEDAKHGPVFKEAATRIGLAGRRMAHVRPNAQLNRRLEPIVAQLGPLPHAKLNFLAPPLGRKPQVGRNLKCWCIAEIDGEPCGNSHRASAGNIRKIQAKRGIIKCLLCDAPMKTELDDKVVPATPVLEAAE